MSSGWREQAKILHSDQIVSMISLWKSRIKPAELCPGCSQGTARPMTAASSCWLKWMSGKAEATRQSFNLSTTSPQFNKSRWTIPPGYNSSVNIYFALHVLLSQPGCIIENREFFFFFFKEMQWHKECFLPWMVAFWQPCSDMLQESVNLSAGQHVPQCTHC